MKKDEIRKDPKKMTEHELRTEVIKRRAEVNRLRKSIWQNKSKEE